MHGRKTKRRKKTRSCLPCSTNMAGREMTLRHQGHARREDKDILSRHPNFLIPPEPSLSSTCVSGESQLHFCIIERPYDSAVPQTLLLPRSLRHHLLQLGCRGREASSRQWIFVSSPPTFPVCVKKQRSDQTPGKREVDICGQ